MLENTVNIILINMKTSQIIAILLNEYFFAVFGGVFSEMRQDWSFVSALILNRTQKSEFIFGIRHFLTVHIHYNTP